MWTFARKLTAGFALSFVLLVAIGVTAYRGIDSLTGASYSVAHSHEVLERIGDVLSALIDAETGQRGFTVTGQESFLDPFHSGTERVITAVEELRALTVDNARQQERCDQLEPLVGTRVSQLAKVVELRRSGGFEAARDEVATGEGKRAMDDLRRLLGQMEAEERRLLEQRATEVETTATWTRTTVVTVTLVCAVFVSVVGFSIIRSVSGQVGSAVRNIESSSAELQAAATQQVTGTKEQVAAMSEISTTINELLATSRQIAESAQRVAQIATDTARSAKGGDSTVGSAHDSIATIRRQVDLIVGHMLDLGKKSQQIGAVLDIVAELAEQTNILAINATIEAAGAGEHGKRFAVVADEIRKLADRVADSTKEIRALIDDVRAAVNTTVMATEGGSKAVDAGSRQFGDVAASFRQIAEMVATTTEASREIELSTKQQATAVEQVKIAIVNVTEATRETESSAGQTMQTAQQLTVLSRELLRVIETAPPR